jgi:hypothetical protein
LSKTFGEHNISTIAEIHHKLQTGNVHEKHHEQESLGEFSQSYADKTAGLLAKRGEKLVEATHDYKKHLLQYHKAIKSKNPGARATAKIKAKAAFDNMQKHFQAEMKLINGRSAAKQVTPLNSFRRATTLAESGAHVSKLNVVDQVEASKIGKLAKSSKLIGNGLAVLDFTTGIAKINTSYQKGENWEREMFVESSAFVATAVIGEAAAEVGALLLMATPIGWVGLLVAGAVIVGTAGVAAVAAGAAKNKIENNAGGVFDDIMNWVKSK